MSLLPAALATLAVVRLTRDDAASTVAAVEVLARGDVRDHDVPDGRDEFGDIGRALDQATRNLRATLSGIGDKTASLASTISASISGVADVADTTSGHDEQSRAAAEEPARTSSELQRLVAHFQH